MQAITQPLGYFLCFNKCSRPDFEEPLEMPVSDLALHN
jgi:hypothetical protein